MLVVGGFLIIAAVTFAQTWSPAPVNPPSNNAASPINVSGVAQAKAGNFVADVVGANGFCIKDKCIYAWPTGSGISASDIKIVEASKTNTYDAVATKVECGPGYKVIGGGFDNIRSNPKEDATRERAIDSYPSSDSSWTVAYKDAHVKVYAICVKVS